MPFFLHSLITLSLLLLVTGIALLVIIAGLLAWGLLHPPRMTDGKAVYRLKRLSPGDLGMDFENCGFAVRDRRGKSVFIAGWWIPAPHPTSRCVVLIHGYADAKVGAIAWAFPLQAAGVNILAIDLRAHGDSSGWFTTGGYFERDDVSQVIDQLRIDRPDQTRQLALFGASLGAAVALAVAVDRPISDVAAVVLESPFTDYTIAIRRHVESTGLPSGRVLTSALWIARCLSGARFDRIRPIDLLQQIHCPALMIFGADDQLLGVEQIERFRSLAESNPPPKNCACWIIPHADHLQAMAVQPIEYADRLNRFLASALAVPPSGILSPSD